MAYGNKKTKKLDKVVKKANKPKIVAQAKAPIKKGPSSRPLMSAPSEVRKKASMLAQKRFKKK